MVAFASKSRTDPSGARRKIDAGVFQVHGRADLLEGRYGACAEHGRHVFEE